MPHIAKKHPLALRWFHWVNFPLIMVMIWSGLLIYWANQAYKVKIFGVVLFKFFPAWFVELMGMKYRLATGMSWHFVFMWFFMVNGIGYAAFLIFSGGWRHIFPASKQSFISAWHTVLHDLGLRKEPSMVGKYNGAQQLAYSGVVVLGVLAFLSGWAIYKPTQLFWLTTALGGYESARLIHFIVMVLLSLFFFVHIAQVAKAGWNNFQAMVTGWEIMRTSPTPSTLSPHPDAQQPDCDQAQSHKNSPSPLL